MICPTCEKISSAKEGRFLDTAASSTIRPPEAARAARAGVTGCVRVAKQDGRKLYPGLFTGRLNLAGQVWSGRVRVTRPDPN